MSAERLREAADRLEALISEVTPGPWWQHRDDAEMIWYGSEAETYRLDALRGGSDAEWDAWAESTGQLLHGDVRRAEDAAYIAAMHPGVGKALAAWLRLEADVIAARGDQYAVDITGDHALAVADAILGGAS